MIIAVLFSARGKSRHFICITIDATIADVELVLADLALSGATYIQGILSGGGMGSEWDFVKGGALLRVTGTLKPSAAGLHGANFGGRQVNQSAPSSP